MSSCSMQLVTTLITQTNRPSMPRVPGSARVEYGEVRVLVPKRALRAARLQDMTAARRGDGVTKMKARAGGRGQRGASAAEHGISVRRGCVGHTQPNPYSSHHRHRDACNVQQTHLDISVALLTESSHISPWGCCLLLVLGRSTHTSINS